MKTFTNYAGKKAKQFLNLLQGYTKGIRMTAILILLLMGVNSAWAGDATIYVTGHIFKDSWDASKSEVRIAYNYNSNSGNKWTGHKSMTLTQYTYNGYPIYSYEVESSTNWAEIFFYHYKDGQHFNSQQQYTGGWTEFTNNKNKVYVGWIDNAHRWVELCEENTFYFLKNGNTTNWTNLYAYAWSSSINNSWPGTSMTNTGKTYNGTPIYSVKLYCTYATIIFNQGNGTNQSGDQTTSGNEGKIFDYKNNKWLAYNYDVKVTFNANGHGTAPTAKTVLKGGKVSEPTAPDADGYTFGGWYKEVGCTNVFDFNTAINEDITLYAKWTISAAQYTVTLNTQYGEGGSPSVQAYVGFAMPEITLPTRTGYIFGGYYTEQNGLGTQYYKADGTSAKNWDKTTNTTLFAKWTPITYYVQFNANGGEGSMEEQEFTYNVPQNLTANTFTKTGYNFLRWNTKSDGSGTPYADKNNVNNLTTTNGEKITLYAQWQAIRYNITYTSPTNGTYCLKVGEGEDWHGNTTAIYEQQITLRVQTEAAGYHFAGWTVTKAGGGTITVTDNKFTMPAEDITIAAIFAPNIYTITWDANGGTVDPTTSTYTYDGDPVTLPTPKREGYTFNGWFTEQSGGTQITEIGTTNKPTSNVTYYAQWSEITYTVNISTDGNGSVSPSGDQQIGIEGLEVTAAPKDPSRFRFTKWEVSGGAQVADPYGAITTITATAEGTVIAHFEELQPKTIYLKTVEGTTDGVTWYVKYNDTEYLMDELGCTGEYYQGEVLEGTSFQFVSRDASNNIVETKGTDLQYVEGKTLYNLVSLSAGGNKIFFKPNSHWLTKQDGKTPRFAAYFYNPNNEWIDLVDTNSDGIYECEKPAGGYKQIQFCRMKENTTENNWNNRSEQTQNLTIPTDGKNLFTVDADQENNCRGTWSEFVDTPVNGDGEWTTFTGITYRITFDQQVATTVGTTHVDVAYHASMPEIEKLPAKNEKKFGGYYTEEDGQGVMLVNAFGEWQNETGYISSTTWEREGCVTLYAYWKDLTPEITDVTLNTDIFEPVDENDEEVFVTAVPTIDRHNNDDPFIVCWKLLYTNGREVEGEQYKATPVEGNKVQFSIAGLSTGTYTIRASLHTGNACGSGEEISRFDKQFSIVANRIVTVNYTCDGREIMASTKQNAHVINPTPITAPDIIGYTFKEWVAGDGVIISTANKASKTIQFTAYYDGYLTATYTKNDNIIYFYNTLNWSSVYIYLYNSSGYWDNDKGAGASGSACVAKGAMTKIEGTDIWYYDLAGVNNFGNKLAFTEGNHSDHANFNGCQAVYRTDYNSAIPMFVPIKGQNPEQKNNTNYYNKGYWMNYPENTGYKLQIYDKVGDGAKEVASVRFPYSTNTIMPLTVSVDLEAGKTYGFKILREDNTYYSNSGTMIANSNGWSFTNDVSQNCGLKTTLAGDYTFTLKYANYSNNTDYNYRVDVVYPVSVGDYRVIYKDKAQWSQTAAHGDNWYHPSYAIKKNSSNTEEKTDIVSFFIAKDNNPVMKFQKCTAINEQTVTWADVTNGTITIPNDVVTAAGVYNFIVKQPTNGGSIAVESVEPYTGNYYIRVDAMDGKWGNYKTDPDNRMTYSAFSENRSKNKFGELFSHYATKWCKEGTNVKFTIANDYSPCISDTLIQDNGNPFNNIDEHGNLTSNSGKHAANIRFMWNRKTNKISRAYVAGSTFTDRQFLILKANKEIKNSSGGSLSNAGDNHNAHQAIFSDTQNWIYERTIQVQPGTCVKLYACYPTTDVANAQYFRGTYDNNNATWNEDNSVQILGGTGASWNTIRIIYDFKTNRLMAAWLPTGEINEQKSLQADMMILREHQEDAACITFADSDDKLVNIKTIYGVLRLNKYILNNKKTTGNHEILDPKDQKSIYERALYFISFPFDVHLSDVFGFGTYGTHWVISEYNGLRRAQNGYFVDNCMNEDCTNWDYIWDPSNFTMKANQGYLLSLDLDLMKDNNESFWAHGINTVELYFPSYEHVQTIQQTDYTMDALGEKYRCTINYSNLPGHTEDSDRRVKDSYWRCIGVPSFANYDGSLSDDSNNVINWKSDYTWKPDDAAFPFLYEWNVSDNSLSVQNTNQYSFRSTFAYLVQNGNQIKWSAVNAKPSSPIVARQRSGEQESNYEWKITLSRGEVQEDQAFIRMTNHEDVTAEFDFGQDLSKELNYGRSDIYTLIGYERAAANSMPLSDSTTVVPLGLDIEQAGDYTIAMPEGVESVGVTLLDAETGERTNLSIGMDYTISLNKGACHNRLYLEISPIQQTTTDIEYTDQGTREQSVRKVLIDGKLYIVCDGVVYDAQGKRL